MNDLKEKVIPIIKKTRDITLPHFGTIEIHSNKGGGAHDVVTRIDQEVELFLKTELNNIYPEVEFVGEEFSGNRDAEKFWLVDPIDGTAHYIRGMPFCTTMLALIDKGQVVFSVIYDFVNDNIYYAEKGKGAYKNGLAIHVSTREKGDWYMGFETKLNKPENLEKYLGLRGISMQLRTVSAGYEYAMVAEGKLEGRVSLDPYGKDYDHAPGSLLVSEAGGVVTNLYSKKYDYTNVNLMAVSIPLHKELTEAPDALFSLN